MSESIEILMKYQTEINRLNQELEELRKHLIHTNQSVKELAEFIKEDRNNFKDLLDVLLIKK